MATFVLVHGICHGAWCWDRVERDLVDAGHQVVAVDLALTSLDDDAAIVTSALDALDMVGEPVVLVGHSYGGLVISRAAAGRATVDHLVYVAAVLLDGSDVFVAKVAEFPPSKLGEGAEISDDGVITVSPDAAVTGFYNECDPADAAAAASRLRPTAVACLAMPPDAEPWRHIPSTYVLCTKDQAIHPDMQQWMAQRASRIVTFDTDHSPFLSTPEQLVKVLTEVA